MMFTMYPLLVGFLTALGVNADLCPWDEADLLPWSGGASTWGSEEAVPAARQNVVIPANKTILLDISPPALESLTIESGGALIWGDVEGLTLEAFFILVEGRFQIGSTTCRFKKKATIILAGKIGEMKPSVLFDSKFLGVNAGGTLEFHGKDKLGWTKLIQTLPVGLDTCGVLYNHKVLDVIHMVILTRQRKPSPPHWLLFLEEVFGEEGSTGLHSIVFNKDGSVFDFDVFKVTDPVQHFQAFIDVLPNDVILAVAAIGNLGESADRSWSSVYESLEAIGGLAHGSSQLRGVNDEDAYVFIVHVGSGQAAVEDVAEHDSTSDYVKTNVVSISNSGLVFSASTTRNNKAANFHVLTEEVAHPVIKVNNDVSSWEPGDTVIVTSTDWEWRQTEEFILLPCPECATNQVKLDHEAKYMHYGQMTYGVDERAEVALISRNILIKGTLEKECYSTNANEEELCTFFNEDTYGGHFKMVKGFESVHIEGCEITQMGQQQVIGTYPIHFHMCDDVDGAWVRNNSIHHCKSRFVTVHGTDGLEVSGNVGYKTLGHGFFLEDGVEQRNVLDGNLGLGVMHGSHLLSDRKQSFCAPEIAIYCDALSVFWLTHPNNKIRNNVAAGSDTSGFWYITSKEALSISNDYQKIRGSVPPMHAFYSKIDEFTNNVAHSNHGRGLRIDARISIGEMVADEYVPENGIITATSSHYPRDPPTEDGELVVSVLDGFTGYKNPQNVWTKAGKLSMTHFTLADSPRGIAMARGNDMYTWTEITDSLFVGETDNVGMVDEPYGRSLSRGGPQDALQGIKFYQGPSFVRNSYFTNYEERTWNGFFRPAGAISFKRSNPYPLTTSSTTEGIKFGFCDKTEGNWVFNGNSSLKFFDTKDGTRQASFHDVDGSVTGHADTQVVNPHRIFTTDCCSHRPNWNMAVCPYDYAKLQIKGEGGALVKSNIKHFPTTIFRDDRPNDPFTLEGERGLIYLVLKGKSYMVQFNGDAPDKVQLFGQNMFVGDSIRVGLCFPKDVEGFEFASLQPRISKNIPAFPVSTVEELDSDTTGRAYFWDSAAGLLFVKVVGFSERIDGEKCPGYRCPGINIVRIGGNSSTATCFDAAYTGEEPYKKSDTCSEVIPDPLPCSSTIPSLEGYGMPIVPSIEDDPVFTPTCPPPVSHEGRGSIEYIGCYKDKMSFHDLPHHYQVLSKSMTPEFCVERCYHHGYAYAGLQNGLQCHCGNAYGVFGEANGGCTKPCSGDTGKMCGGAMTNDVYSTGNPPEAPLESCESGKPGVLINGDCFQLGDSEVSFTEGERQCFRLGGHLAKIDSEETQSEVETYLRQFRSDVWIGLTDVEHEGDFKWMDGSELGEYSHFRDQISAPDFVFLEVSSVFHWQVSSLTTPRRPLCQISGAPPTTTKCGTNDYGNRIGNSSACYLVQTNSLNYIDSQYFCWTRNGRLAPITDTSKSEIIQHIHWFGLSGKQDYWIQGENPSQLKALKYMEMFKEGSAKKRNKNGAVCLLEDVDANKPCSSGWKLYEDHCYLFSNYISKSFTKAQAVCHQGISNMVSIKDTQEHEFVINMAKAYAGSNPYIYLGLKYNAGSFKWVDGLQSDVSFWRKGHGLTNTSKGKCVRIRIQNEEWLNIPCAGRGASVLCKAPAAG